MNTSTTSALKAVLVATVMSGLLATATVAGAFFASPEYQATWISQTQPDTEDGYFDVLPCQTVGFQATFRNTGTATWQQVGAEQVAFNIYKDPSVVSYPNGFPYKPGSNDSYFSHESWLTPFRIGAISDSAVAPGELARIPMQFQVPCEVVPGKYREDISMAVGPHWMQANAAYGVLDKNGNPGTGDPLGVAHIWVGFDVRDTHSPQLNKVVIDESSFTDFFIELPGGWGYHKLPEYGVDGTPMQEHTTVLITKEYGQMITIDRPEDRQPVECTYDDSPGADKPGSHTFAAYTEIATEDGTLLRRSHDSDLSTKDTIYYTVCQQQEDGTFIDRTQYGYITYENISQEPLNADNTVALLLEMDSIVQTLYASENGGYVEIESTRDQLMYELRDIYQGNISYPVDHIDVGQYPAFGYYDFDNYYTQTYELRGLDGTSYAVSFASFPLESDMEVLVGYERSHDMRDFSYEVKQLQDASLGTQELDSFFLGYSEQEGDVIMIDDQKYIRDGVRLGFLNSCSYEYFSYDAANNQVIEFFVYPIEQELPTCSVETAEFAAITADFEQLLAEVQ